LERVARRLGFEKVRQKGGHARWRHPDGRATTIPIHGDADIGNWLFHEIIRQLGISEEEFLRLR
jgi:predicted RNA binding protein YcfA (HicA-like mRNA interferase family)